MRGILLTAIVFATLPLILYRPYIGVLVWSWLGYMNPHSLTFGFAYDFPYSQIVAIVTIVGLVLTKDKKGLPLNKVTVTWLIFIVWMWISTQLALVPERADWEFDRTIKIQLISIITVLLIYKQKHVLLLVWVIVLSLGFYGVKGGIFSILSGGVSRVYGPSRGFIEDNNALALALIMIVPLIRFLYGQVEPKWGKYLVATMGVLVIVSIFGSQSRGALVGGAAMVLFLILKSENRFRFLIPVLVLMVSVYSFMPASWHERMSTIKNYEEDTSAMGRINAWYFSVNLALDHPAFGGGFGVYTPEIFRNYAPEPEDFHDSHSIYFEVLAEHGFGGLMWFLLLGLFTFMLGSSIIKRSRGSPDIEWTGKLAAMMQVGLVGYAVTGAFLGLAYFDLLYHYVALMVVLDRLIRESATETPGVKQAGAVQSRLESPRVRPQP